MSKMTLSSQEKPLFQKKNSLTTPIFLLCSCFRAHSTTLLLKILGDQCMGRPPPQILGDRPPSPSRSPHLPDDCSSSVNGPYEEFSVSGDIKITAEENF